MRRLTVILACIISMAILGCGASMVQVQSGTKITCSKCGKVIKSDIETKKVPQAEVSQYSVQETTEVCETCQAKEAAERRKAQTSSIVGSWVYKWTMTDVILKINSDGTGTFSGSPLKWQESGGEIKGTWVTDMWGSDNFTFHFTLTPASGERLHMHFLNTHWDWMLGQDLIFDRL
ncbi:MAG: hypothetical protein HW405_772 [Candidatus Berkelbacteria bacterium]|nr:hypothetical protein [Candidatus Berkelbacteria bacterium]